MELFATHNIARVLITGDRDWDGAFLIYDTLRALASEMNLLVIHGGARGADSHAGFAAHQLGLLVLKFPADWEQYGKAAGPVRNRLMLDIGKPHVVIAFHDRLFDGSKGTLDMVKAAIVERVPVFHFQSGGEIYEAIPALPGTFPFVMSACRLSDVISRLRTQAGTSASCRAIHDGTDSQGSTGTVHSVPQAGSGQSS